MIDINVEHIDWLLIRQALSLALLKNKPVAIHGGPQFLKQHPEYRPLFEDLSRTTAVMGTGRLACENEILAFEPRPLPPGSHSLESPPLSSAVELLLFLMPCLLYGDFRSILNFRGVTHSIISHPTSFIKESLLKAIEELGFYASLTLKRFGFQGSGGGIFESRIYPHEAKRAQIFSGQSCALSGVTIFISHLNTDLAMREKFMLAELLGLDENKIAIIEIIDSDGIGNSIQALVSCGGINVILSRDALVCNERGGITCDESDIPAILTGLSDEVKALTGDRVLPEHIIRELYPYIILSGSEFDYCGHIPSVALTRDLCKTILL